MDYGRIRIELGLWDKRSGLGGRNEGVFLRIFSGLEECVG